MVDFEQFKIFEILAYPRPFLRSFKICFPISVTANWYESFLTLTRPHQLHVFSYGDLIYVFPQIEQIFLVLSILDLFFRSKLRLIFFAL